MHTKFDAAERNQSSTKPPSIWRRIVTTRSNGTTRRAAYLAGVVVAVLAMTTLFVTTQVAPAQAQGNSERDALEALYNSTDGPNWTNTTGWLEASDHCTWFGIACNQQGQVDVIELIGNGLRGPIPTEIASLASLSNLDLRANDLTGQIPAELGGLTNLTNLDLSFNGLVGEIPTEIGNLTRLVNLGMRNNGLVGEIPSELGNLVLLRDLVLGLNALEGEIPTELGNLVNLDTLFLTQNQLSGQIPSELGNLTNLRHLWLENNNLSGELPAELGLTGLTILSATNNNLQGPLPPEIANITGLETIQLSNNNFSGEIPSELANLGNLGILSLEDNDLTGEIPAELANLANLRSLALAFNRLSGRIPAEFSVSNLTFLSLQNNDCLTAPANIMDWLATVIASDINRALCAVQQTHGGPDWASNDEHRAIASNESGDVAFAAVKRNGDAWARRGTNNVLSEWVQLGTDAIDTVDIALDADGNAEIVAIDQNGALLTRTWVANGGLTDWVLHGQPTWAQDAQPAISTNGADVVIAAVKVDGRLFTRVRTNDLWQRFERQGATRWEQADVSIAANGDIVLIATKDNGRLYTRQSNTAAAEWFSFTNHGRASWLSSAVPSVEVSTQGAVIAAVKDDGRLFTRELFGATWQGFQRHGGAGWQSVTVDLAPSRAISLAAVKANGRLFSRQYSDGWQDWNQFEPRIFWSGKPGVANTDETTHVLAVTAADILRTFTIGG